jgi:hypothetical protein
MPKNQPLTARVMPSMFRAAAAAVCVLGTAGWPSLASAQSPSTSCAQIQAPTERLACYDRAFPPTPAASPTAAAPAAATAAGAAAAAAPAEQSANHIATDRSAPRSAAAQAPPSPGAPAAPAAPATTQIGAAPTQSGHVEAGIVPIVIVDVRDTPGRHAKVFTADNGATWVQTDGAALNTPSTPFNAEIKPGMAGSFFLVPANKGRAVRVRRGEN